MRAFWMSEACDLAADPVTGSRITRLTAAAMHSINIYFEQPHTTPDGSRIAFLRSSAADPRLPPTSLWAADLDSKKAHLIDADVACTWIATSSWSGILHYVRSSGELMRFDLTTMRHELLMHQWPLPIAATLWSATPDMRYLIANYNDHDYHANVTRIDTHTGKAECIYRHPEIHGHIQIEHTAGRDILMQRNRGMRMNHLRDIINEPVEHSGAIHVVIDIDGGNERQLPIGEPHTAPTTGHASWVGDTGRIATPVHWPGASVDFVGDQNTPAHDQRHPTGNQVIASPGDEKPVIFPAAEHLFIHAGSSKCGRYFVAESVKHGIPGAVEIVVGCFATGKYATLIQDCGASCGGPSCSHVHVYFTADNKRVIYNSDRFGLAQVHAATVPDGFLEALS